MAQISEKMVVATGRVLDAVIRGCITDGVSFGGKDAFKGVIYSGLDRMWSQLWPLSVLPSGRVVDFCVYQLYRFRDMIEQYPGTRWELRWCFSDGAVEKYRQQFMSEKGRSGINYYIDCWLRDGGLSRGVLVAMMGDPRSSRLEKFLYVGAEERTKQRFYNREAGKLLCWRATTGYSVLSASCRGCDYKKECEEHFKRFMPELMRLRCEKNNKNV